MSIDRLCYYKVKCASAHLTDDFLWCPTMVVGWADLLITVIIDDLNLISALYNPHSDYSFKQVQSIQQPYVFICIVAN